MQHPSFYFKNNATSQQTTLTVTVFREATPAAAATMQSAELGFTEPAADTHTL
jgi:hypothetical protein